MQTLLIAAIVAGIFFGLILELTTQKEKSKGILNKMDHLLLVYLFPLLLLLTAARIRLDWAQAKVTALMAVAMTLSFGAAWVIAKTRLKLGSSEHGTMMRNGFLVLAVCSNTGHGVMLASSATSDPAILGLLMGPMYIGFLCVISLPQFLVNRSEVKGFVWGMIMWHPVSYGSLAGFIGAICGWQWGFAWLAMVGLRFIVKRNNKNAAHMNWRLFISILAGMTLYHFGGDFGGAFFGYFPVFILFVTAITIGMKLLENWIENTGGLYGPLSVLD